MQIEILFLKKHPDAQLPQKKHGNREICEYEKLAIEKENERFSQENPQAYASGYRVGFPFAQDGSGILGTGDTGYDIFSVEDTIIPAKGSKVVDTGIEVAYISPGYWFNIAPRSGLGFKHGIQPHLGTIDNPYRGNLGIKLYNFSDVDYPVAKGDRIAQIVIYPVIEATISWSDKKIETERNENGFGSSGK